MKWFHALNNLFKPEEIQDIKTEDILFSLNDPTVRKIWIQSVFGKIVQINKDVDLRLQRNPHGDLSDLAFRRQGIQDVLEAVLDAKRQAKGNNPVKGEFDLNSVTVQPV